MWEYCKIFLKPELVSQKESCRITGMLVEQQLTIPVLYSSYPKNIHLFQFCLTRLNSFGFHLFLQELFRYEYNTI